jgi:tetratricopeptide (TPR) repeat protein
MFGLSATTSLEKTPLALQDDVTGKIVGAMTGETGQIKKGQYQDAWGKDTTDLGEYDYYLRGHDAFMNFTKADNDRAGRIWEEGLAKYPDSNLLKVKLGWYHFVAATSFWSDDASADYRKAGELVRSVLAKDNLSPQVKRLAHWLFAMVLMTERDFDRALNEADTVITLAPYDGSMFENLARLAIVAGKPDKGLEWVALARTRDPNGLKMQTTIRAWPSAYSGNTRIRSQRSSSRGTRTGTLPPRCDRSRPPGPDRRGQGAGEVILGEDRSQVHPVQVA